MLIRTDNLAPWRGEALRGVRHPLNIEALWSAGELAAIGLVKAIPMVVPDGFRAAGMPTYAGDGRETIPLEAIPPPTAQEVDVGKERILDNEVATLAVRVLFEHENRIRALERNEPVTAEQFRAALKARL